MAVEFTAAQNDSYEEYLASHNLRTNIEIALAPDIRALIGPVPAIFRTGDGAPNGAIRDYRRSFSGPDGGREVAVVNLWAIAEQLSPLDADLVTAFQALFVMSDEVDERLASLQRHADVPATGKAGEACSAALANMSRHKFGQALAALPRPYEHPGGGMAAQFILRMRGRLLAGVPGYPDSAELLNLNAAEVAYLAAARTAAPLDKAAAAVAFIGAGRAAYADRRPADAEQHFRDALAQQESGEARYQLARLRIQAMDRTTARDALIAAFETHWSFALRAAAEALFLCRKDLVCRCVREATRRVTQQARSELAAAHAALAFLEQAQDPVFGLDRFPAHATIQAELGAIKKNLSDTTLKSAFDLRKRCRQASDAIVRLAVDYCALLVQAENEIVMHDAQPAKRRPPTAIAASLGVFFGRLCEVAAMLAIGAGFAVATGALGTDVPLALRHLALAIGLGGGAIALLPPSGMRRREWMRRRLEPVLAVWQERLRAREYRRIEARRERNRLALQDRFARLAQRFAAARVALPTIDRDPDPATTAAEHRLAS